MTICLTRLLYTLRILQIKIALKVEYILLCVLQRLTFLRISEFHATAYCTSQNTALA